MSIQETHFHSINTQIAFYANYKIIDLVAKWPGATHDARILREGAVEESETRGVVDRKGMKYTVKWVRPYIKIGIPSIRHGGRST